MNSSPTPNSRSSSSTCFLAIVSFLIVLHLNIPSLLFLSFFSHDPFFSDLLYKTSVRVTLRQCHYYNQRYSREGELTGSEHTGTLMQWLFSEIKLRGAYCISDSCLNEHS